MSVRWPRGRLARLQLVAWALVGTQVPVTGLSVWNEARARLQFQQAMLKAPLRRERPAPGNPGLKVGLRVARLPVSDASGAPLDLLKRKAGRQGIVFISSCAPCASDLVREYESLWSQRLPISVVARTPPAEIVRARREFGWALPIFSDYGRPAAAANCRIVYPPAALVLDRDGRVVYGQGDGDDQVAAVSKVRKALLEQRSGR